MSPIRYNWPLAVSSDGRYFVDADGEPVFWLGDTQWELLRLFAPEQARQIVEARCRQGFSALQIMLVGVDPLANIHGEAAWIAGDPARPNEKYFAHADEVIDVCRNCGDPALVVGVYHTARMKGAVHEGNAREWARRVARRYAHLPSIVWSMYPRAEPECVDVCRLIAAGLAEGDGGSHLITVHPDPSPASSGSILHTEDWLAFNSSQTHRRVDLVVPMVAEDYAREPAKPVVMAEGAYEAGADYGFEVTPLWLRRQAYYTQLAGGYHSYGHEGFWRIGPTWPEALEAPGARQMGVLRQAFTGLPEWWRLTPDQALLTAGGRTDSDVLTLAARHAEGRWAVVYAAEPTRFTLAMHQLSGATFEAFWIDPRTGGRTEAAATPADDEQTFATPDGFEDGLLVVQAT